MEKIKDSAYNSLLHNIMRGFQEASYKGQYEYTHYQKIPKFFCEKLSNCFKDKGFKVKFRDTLVSIKCHYVAYETIN